MKKQKGRVIPSDSEILRRIINLDKRLDKIEKNFNLTFTYTVLLTCAIFAISVATGLFGIYYSTKNYSFLASGLFAILVGFVIIAALELYLIWYKFIKK